MTLTLGSSHLVAFVAITEVERARAFYDDTLGLNVAEVTPFACVMNANGTMLRLTPVENHSPATHTVVGWSVSDIVGVVRWLAGRGVTFRRWDGMNQDDLGIWTTPGGDRVAWFTDPDGNILSVTEHAEP